MRRAFENSLESLNENIVLLGMDIKNVILKTKEAMISLDRNHALAIIENDKMIDRKEIGILNEAMGIMVREQPVAKDLRFILASFVIVRELEHIADHCKNIAKLVLKLKKHNAESIPESVVDLCDLTTASLEMALKSFTDRDLALAEKVQTDDVKINDVYRSRIRWFKEKMEANPEGIDRYVDYIFISKYFERIGDRNEAIGEQVFFIETGEYLE